MQDSSDGLTRISKEAMAALAPEVYKGRIVTVQTRAEAIKAINYLKDCKLVGFDTETKPSYKKGDLHNVALMQLSSENVCFLIRINRIGIIPELKDFLENPDIVKIGLSTKDDFHVLNRLVPLQPKGFVELQQLVKEHGIGEGSLTKIYSILFGKRISKRQRLTNWEAMELTESQKRYAALDAWACLRIYRYLLNL